MELEVRHLRVICTIAEAGSVSRAAAALRVSQPGLTAQLHRIERMLGGQLFVRGPNGITPTQFGEMVLARARAVLPTIEELRRATVPGTGGDGDPDILRLGSVNAPILASVVAGLRDRYPRATVTVRGEGSPVPLVELVASGRLELAIAGENPVYELPARAEVAFHTVATEPVFLLMSSEHPLASHTELELGELAEEDFALPQPDDDRTREYYALACLAAGFAIRVPYEIEGTPLTELVRAGHAVSFCQPTFRGGPGLAIRPLVGTPLWYRHVLVWHRHGPFAGRAAVVSRIAAESYAEAVRRNTTYPAWLARHADLIRPEPVDRVVLQPR
jgi:DNA-binding transcriptional LysR family regulator